jgi:glycyl-tRNA synthetase beta chain
MIMAEFLIEILSEEIPARMQLRAADDLKKLLGDDLQARGLTFASVDTFVTPRRLIAVVTDLNDCTLGTVEERRGPKLGAPDGAIQGFLKSTGMTLESCEQRDGYYYAHIESKPRQTRDLLPEIVHGIFSKFVWPKSMFWTLEDGKNSQFWVRAVRSVVTLFGGQPVSFDLPALGIKTTNQSVGHRFLAPAAIEVSSFSDYKAKLEKAFVIIDHQDRQRRIWEGLEALAHQKGLTIQADEGLLQEVAGLVEYPVPLLGNIESKFMDLPSSVLSTSMRVHQKYFTILTEKGEVAPYFGVVANTNAADDGAKMIRGYERVLRARLSDAQFFYHQDVKIPLEDFSNKLISIVFQAKLGTLHQKSERLATLMTAQGADNDGRRAAMLAKADLLTSMVGEFPELQGVMGEIYATAQGEEPHVAAAIREHYQPQGPYDQCPSAPLSIALGLADKLDTLVGFFGIGEEPTGSKDPFALRRAALGIIRLIRENGLEDLSLQPLCCQAIDAYKSQGIIFKPDFQFEGVLNFINDRLKVALRAEGMRHDCVSAVIDRTTLAHAINVDELAQSPEFTAIQNYIGTRSHNIFSLSKRAKALADFLGSANGAALSATFRRVDGIVENEITKDGYFYLNIKPELLLEEPEKKLHHHLEEIIKVRESLLDTHDYTGWMAQLASLRETVDAFFDSLKVNDDRQEIRANRLALLGKLRIQTELIANFSKIEG